MEELLKMFPGITYVTPSMIAESLDYDVQMVRYYCRQLFPCHHGEYRFYIVETARPKALNHKSLNDLIVNIRQSSRQIKARINI